jgi:hypothetical protein
VDDTALCQSNLVIQPLHRFACIASCNFASNRPNPSLLELKAFGPPIFRAISKYSSWTILCTNQILCSSPCIDLCASSAAICRHRLCALFLPNSFLPSLISAQAIGYPSCSALFRVIQCGLEFVQTNFCAPALAFLCSVIVYVHPLWVQLSFAWSLNRFFGLSAARLP